MIKCWVRAESKDMAESAAYDANWTSDNKRDAKLMDEFPPDSTEKQELYEVTITARKVTAKRKPVRKGRR